ncbi:MAG: TIGR03905 family TSCPD domain-containing protein [Bacteroidia bacterium]|nr:TIGR03905 family TSCPD domain-containing protein [Bacteroidia bacterium]
MYEITPIKDETTAEGIRIIYATTCRDVCSQQVAAAVKDGVIVDAGFAGGCSGNTQGIVSLVKGMKVEDAVSRLEGIRCGGKGTSCPDQLARLLKLFL